MKNALKLAAVFAGALIGAGFASGRELQIFFVQYGTAGLWGLAAALVLLFCAFAKILVTIRLYDIETFTGYFTPFVGKWAAGAFSVLTRLFMAAMFFVMVAGAGAAVEQFFGLSRFWGIFGMLAVCFVCFLMDAGRLAAFQLGLLPLLLFGMLAVGVYGLTATRAVFSPMTVMTHPAGRSVLYASYNVLTLICVMLPYRKLITSRKTALWAALFGCTAVASAALVLWLCLYHINTGGQLPMLEIAAMGGRTAEGLYFCVLLAAMFTTAVANGFGVVADAKRRPLAALGLCLLAIPFCLIPFAALMEHLYVLFGFLGLGVFLLILLH